MPRFRHAVAATGLITAAALAASACAGPSGSLSVPELNQARPTATVDPGATPSTAPTLDDSGTFLEDDATANAWNESDPGFGTPEYSEKYYEKKTARQALVDTYGPASGSLSQDKWNAIVGGFGSVPAGVASSLDAPDTQAVYALTMYLNSAWHTERVVAADTSEIRQVVPGSVSAVSTQAGIDRMTSRANSIVASLPLKGGYKSWPAGAAADYRLIPAGWCSTVPKTTAACIPLNQVRVQVNSIGSLTGEKGARGASVQVKKTYNVYLGGYEYEVTTDSTMRFWRNPDPRAAATWSFDDVTVDGWWQEVLKAPEPTAEKKEARQETQRASFAVYGEEPASQGIPRVMAAVLGASKCAPNEACGGGETKFPPGCTSDCGNGPGTQPVPPGGSSGGGGGPVEPLTCPAGYSELYERGTVGFAANAGLAGGTNKTYFDPVTREPWPEIRWIEVDYTYSAVPAKDANGKSTSVCRTYAISQTAIENTDWPYRLPPILCPTRYKSSLQGPYTRSMREGKDFKVFTTGTGGNFESTKFGLDPQDEWKTCLDGTTVDTTYNSKVEHSGRYVGSYTIEARWVNYYYIPNVPSIFEGRAGAYELESLGKTETFSEDTRWTLNCFPMLQNRTGLPWGDGAQNYYSQNLCTTVDRFTVKLDCPTIPAPRYAVPGTDGVLGAPFRTADVVQVRADNQSTRVRWAVTDPRVTTKTPGAKILGQTWSTTLQFPVGIEGKGMNSPSLNPEIWKGRDSEANSKSQPYRVLQPLKDVPMPLNQREGIYRDVNELGSEYRGYSDEWFIPGYRVSFADASVGGSHWQITPKWTSFAVVDSVAKVVTRMTFNVTGRGVEVIPIMEEERVITEVQQDCSGPESKLSATRVASGSFGKGYRR